jgi:NADH dehydrogenase
MRPLHRVFVTGATGFVGRAVVQALRAEGYVVRCLVRRGSEPDLRGVGAIERVEGDVLSPQTLEEGMAGCDAVVHLVGIIREHVPTNTTFYRVHVQATGNVVAAAASVGVRRYIHMSALGAREGARSRYHQTKWAAEEAVHACSLPWTIVRPSVIYGRSDGFVSLLVRVVRRLPVVPLIGGGRLQPVPVEQVAQGVARALALPAAVKQTYEVGGPDRVTLGELVDLIGKVLGRRRILKVNVPRGVVRAATRVLHRLPYFPLTPDQLLMLEEDNVCDPAPFFSTFGLVPLPLATGLRRLLG